MGVEFGTLKTFRCRVRALGCTMIIDCLAPSARAAAHVIASQGLQDDATPWVQVVVSEWSGVLGKYVEPHNVMVIATGDPAPPGTERVVVCGATSSQVAPL
jgi:hypothetical protein